MHAKGEDREYIEQAIKGGMKILGFADHCPWIFNDGHVSGTRMTPSQLDDYFTSLTDLKKEYSSDIRIYIGFESEYIPELMEAQNRLLADYPVDYMILGEHFLEPEPYGAYTGFENNCESELEKYVDLCIEGLETGKYLYLAHPDLFNFTGPKEIYIKHYTRLCTFLKEHNIPVEINQLGVQQNRHYPSELFLSIASETGNSAIIGCDAHIPQALSDKNAHLACIRLAEKFRLPFVESLPFPE